MLPATHVEELRVALLALFSVATVAPPEVCARVLDAASRHAAEMDPVAVGTPRARATTARLGGVRVLNSLCGACRACPRGRGGYMPTLTADPPSQAV